MTSCLMVAEVSAAHNWGGNNNLNQTKERNLFPLWSSSSVKLNALRELTVGDKVHMGCMMYL